MQKILSSLRIPRFIGLFEKNSVYQVLAFCDASTKSYTAAVYLRIAGSESINQDETCPTGYKRSV